MGRKITQDEFEEKVCQIHGDKYDFSKAIYVNNQTKVCMVCPEHGEFWTAPSNFLRGNGCPKCAKNMHYTTDSFVEKAKLIHNNKYIYTNVEYINSKTKINIICPEHGEFWQSPDKHLQGQKCPLCAIELNGLSHRQTFHDFITKANKIHQDKYAYNDANYVNNATKITITCLKHGDFQQTPDIHLRGHGCPKCNSSKLETEIRNFLNINNIFFEEQKRFEWLGKQSLDFFLPDKNIGIECQGLQHYKPLAFFKNSGGFTGIKKRDQTKWNLCIKNGVTLIYYTHEQIENDANTFFSLIDLQNYLKSFELKCK